MFTSNNLPKDGWKKYMKKSITRMVRIEGPFDVETQHGIVHCSNGFVAIDEDGWPYPIALDVQKKTYLELGEEE